MNRLNAVFWKVKRCGGLCSVVGVVLLSYLPPAIAAPTAATFIKNSSTKGTPSTLRARTRRSRSPRYRPPSTARMPQGPAIPGGRRGGCVMPAELGLTALSPQTHAGRTQSLQPTLAWFVPSEVPYETTLQLYKYVEGEWAIVEQRSLGQSRYGYAHHTLAPSPELSAGHLYRWNIILACDPSRPSASQVASAQFEIVPVQVDVKTSSSSSLQMADSYLAAGLWYDAIAAISSLDTPSQTTYLGQVLMEVSELEEARSPSTASKLQQVARRLLASPVSSRPNRPSLSPSQL